MKKVTTLVLVFAVLLVGVSFSVFAIGNVDGQNNGDCVVKENLYLTEEQEGDLIEAREVFEEKRDSIQEEIRDLHRSSDDNQAEIDELRTELEELREEHMSDVESILTDEQFAQLDQQTKVNMYQGSQGQKEQAGNVQNKGQGNRNTGNQERGAKQRRNK